MLPFSPLTSCRQNVIPQHMYLRPLIGICLLELAVLRIHSVFISNLASDKVDNAGVEYRQKYHPHDIMCVMTWWHLSREVIPRPWSCSVGPGTRAGTRTLPAGSGARTWRRYHTETRSHTGPRSSHAPELFFLCIFCNCLFFFGITSSESNARLWRLTMVSPLRMSLWMAPSSPMMMPDSGLTLYRCLKQGNRPLLLMVSCNNDCINNRCHNPSYPGCLWGTKQIRSDGENSNIITTREWMREC